MRIATFNVRYGIAKDGDDRWEMRKDILCKAIANMDADILGVQECLPFQGDEIKMQCPWFDRFGVGRYHNTLDDRAHESLSGEHCDIFFRSDRFVLEDCGTFWHSDTPDVSGSKSWGNAYPRITTWGRLRTRDEGTVLYVFNVHFHWDEPYVANTANLIADRIASISGDAPVFLMGDFNAGPGDILHDLMLTPGAGRRKLEDLWNVLGMSEEDAGTGHGFNGVPVTRIDWILAAGDVKPVRIECVREHFDGRYPSDHFPVYADVELGS